jgi:hypothetical protein
MLSVVTSGHAEDSKIDTHLYCNPAPPSLHSFSSPNPYCILDSGATGTFVTPSDAQFLETKTTVADGPTVLSANGASMPVTLRGQLPLSKKLSSTAQTAFVLDDLKTGTLISLCAAL